MMKSRDASQIKVALMETSPPMPDRSEIHRWYCTASWARRRAHQLRIERLCRLCLEAGRVEPASVADHVTPHKGDYNAFKLGPLRSLCAACHNRLDRIARARQCVRMARLPIRAIRGTLVIETKAS